MAFDGVLLYGPPAAGKDTVSAALIAVDARYVLFERLKVGSGRMRGYRPATRAQLDALGAAGMLLYANRRYGNTYAIDRPALDHILARGHAQIVHVGQVAGLHALSSYPAKWLTVLLWCPRPISAARLRDRDDNAIAARLAAWDVTYRDVLAAPPGAFGLALRTDHLTPAETARRIDAANRDPHSPPAAADVAEVIAGHDRAARDSGADPA